MIAWVLGAWAGPVDVERARNALAEWRPSDALVAARAAVADDPDEAAWRVLLAACVEVGLDEACRAEVAVTETPSALAALSGEPAAPDDPRALAAELDRSMHSSPDAGAARALELLASHPERPDLLLPLFAADLPPQKSVTKARARVVKAGSKAVAASPPTEVLWRWHRLLVTAHSPTASVTADRLQRAGELRPLDRPPMTRAEMVVLASSLAVDSGTFPAPRPEGSTENPGVREGVGLRLAEKLASAGRHADAAQALERTRAAGDTLSLALAHGELLLTHGDPAAAMSAADAALELAVAPWPTDVAASGRPARRSALAQAMALRGRVKLALEDSVGASVDLLVANQLAWQPIAGAELEKAVGKGWYGLEQIKVAREDNRESAAQVALRLAREAIAREDWAAARQAADDAVAMWVMPAHRKARLTARSPVLPELAGAFAVRALADARSGRPALVDLTVALMLAPFDAHADWWALAAELRAAEGSSYAAFFAKSMADAVAETPDPAAVAGAWPGGAQGGVAAGPAMVAAWMRGDPALEPKSDRLVVERGRVVSFAARGGGRWRWRRRYAQVERAVPRVDPHVRARHADPSPRPDVLLHVLPERQREQRAPVERAHRPGTGLAKGGRRRGTGGGRRGGLRRLEYRGRI
jgi:hypothetical protein